MSSTKNRILRNLLDETKMNLLKIVYELARKRYQQLKISLVDVEGNGGFYSLDFDEKTIIYLKEKGIFDLDQIEFITSASRAEVLSYLYAARIKMASFMPNHLFQSEIKNGGVA